MKFPLAGAANQHECSHPAIPVDENRGQAKCSGLRLAAPSPHISTGAPRSGRCIQRRTSSRRRVRGQLILLLRFLKIQCTISSPDRDTLVKLDQVLGFVVAIRAPVPVTIATTTLPLNFGSSFERIFPSTSGNRNEKTSLDPAQWCGR